MTQTRFGLLLSLSSKSFHSELQTFVSVTFTLPPPYDVHSRASGATTTKRVSLISLVRVGAVKMTSASSETKSLGPALTKKLLLHRHPGARINNEAVLAAEELLRLFVEEARERAAVEAECENEGDATSLDEDELGDSNSAGKGEKGVSIRADHITKVGAELLMDFS